MPTGLNDLLRQVPTGHSDFWANEGKTIRNSEFLYETSFDYGWILQKCFSNQGVEVVFLEASTMHRLSSTGIPEYHDPLHQNQPAELEAK